MHIVRRFAARLWRYRRATGLSAVAILLAATIWLRLGPLPHGLLDERRDRSTVVVDRHGVVLYEALSPFGTRQRALNANTLPTQLVNATLAAEDHRFRRHPGIDPLAVARAAWRNLIEGRVAEGGSTITQQVAKMLLARMDDRPAGARTLRGKLREAMVAIRLEHRFTKNEILALYLNLASYGNQFAGADRASQGYFGCAASMLTPAQAAFLAGLPQRPATFNPYRSQQSAAARQREVLARMTRLGMLTETDAQRARDERLAFTRSALHFRAPHFVEMILAGYGDARPSRIETTLDAALQADVEGIVHSHRRTLDRHGAHNVSVVVLDNRSGGWIAWEGSGNYTDAEHGGTINGPASPRQPGSALKPFTYAVAFENGRSPASVLPDIPSHFDTAEDGILYSPRNYDGRFRGPLLARAALAGSVNVPAVALASDLGVPSLLRTLRRVGLTTFDKNAAHYGLGMTLGNAEVRLDELVAAYATFARGGTAVHPRTTAGNPGPVTVERVFSTRTAFWITDILSDDEARAFAFGRGGSLEFPFQVAVKTGTSQAYHDNWTVGYTRDVTVGVWVGNFDRTPLRDSSGVTGAGPIFHGVMLAAVKRLRGTLPSFDETPIVPIPGDLQRRAICLTSGMAAHPACPSQASEWVADGTQHARCTWHHDTDEGLLTVWPDEYRQWARQAGRLTDREAAMTAALQRSATHVRAEGAGAHPPERLAIVNPPDAAIYLIDPTLRRDFQTLPLRAASGSNTLIEWTVDDRVVGTSAPDRPFMWPLASGTHTITARDQAGNTDSTRILVK